MKLPDEIYGNWNRFGGSVFKQKRCTVFRESLSLHLLFLMCTQLKHQCVEAAYLGMVCPEILQPHFGMTYSAALRTRGIRAIWAKLSSLVRRESGGWRLPFQPLGALVWGADAWHPPCNQETAEPTPDSAEGRDGKPPIISSFCCWIRWLGTAGHWTSC